jgi:hypothetical protein
MDATHLFRDEPGFDQEASDSICLVTDVVCQELGLSDRSDARRQAVLSGIRTTWQGGQRFPLDLVNAGLNAAKG